MHHLHAYRCHCRELYLLATLHHRRLRLHDSAFPIHLLYLEPSIPHIWYHLAIIGCHTHLSGR
jgi:hypothetical protein